MCIFCASYLYQFCWQYIHHKSPFYCIFSGLIILKRNCKFLHWILLEKLTFFFLTTRQHKTSSNILAWSCHVNPCCMWEVKIRLNRENVVINDKSNTEQKYSNSSWHKFISCQLTSEFILGQLHSSLTELSQFRNKIKIA